MFHLPGLIALVVSGLSLVLSIVGIAIPYWLHYEKGGQSSKMGLWFFCFLEDCDKITDQGGSVLISIVLFIVNLQDVPKNAASQYLSKFFYGCSFCSSYGVIHKIFSQKCVRLLNKNSKRFLSN